jgi:hypothetical protein
MLLMIQLCLLNALIKAQDLHIKKHNVDIASIWSTSTLALKVFRTNYLDMDYSFFRF